MRFRTLALVCLLLWAAPAWAQTYVQMAQDDTDPFTGDGIADITMSPTNGNTVCVMFGFEATSRTVTSVVDNVGSTVYALTATDQTASREAWTYCGIVVGSPTLITVTISSALGSGGIAAAVEYSGAHASDSVGNASVFNDATGTTHDSNTLTITGASALASAFIFGTNGTYTADDYTERYDSTAGATNQAVVADKAITANDVLNLTTAGNESTIILLTEILPAAAGGGSPCLGMLLGVGCDE